MRRARSSPCDGWHGVQPHLAKPQRLRDQGQLLLSGHIIQDREEKTLFHLVISQFDKGCGLSSWRRFNYVIRAKSRNGPQGPYEYKKRLTDAFRHNPTTFWSPSDQKYIMYSIGVELELPSACTSSVPGYTENNISVSSAGDIRGPWTTPEYVIDGTNPASFPLWTENELPRLRSTERLTKSPLRPRTRATIVPLELKTHSSGAISVVIGTR